MFTKILIFYSNFKENKIVKYVLLYIKSFFTYLFRVIIPRFVVIGLIWGFFRVTLVGIKYINLDVSFTPIIDNFKIDLYEFFVTMLDLWLLASIIAFFAIILFRTIIEIKNEKL